LKKRLLVVNKTLKADGYYWFIITVTDENLAVPDKDYMRLVNVYYFDWNGENCYLDVKIPIISILCLGVII